MTILVRTEPLDPKLQLVLFIKPLNDNHPINIHPNVTILARVRPDAVNLDKPTGFQNYPVNNLVYYSNQNAINLGKRWADWFQFQGLIKGLGSAYNGLYGGGVFAQNWGTTTGNWSPKALMFNPADRVSGFDLGFHANSTLRNQGTLPDGSLTLGDFIKVAFQTMKTECDNRNLCYPLYICWDWEQQRSAAGLVGTQSSGAGSAPWLATMASSKFSTEIVYEEWDGATWTGKTMANAWEAAGFPSHDPNVYWFQGNNRNWCSRMQPFYEMMNDHALSKALYEPAKEVFPNMICGNYAVNFGLSSTQSNQTWSYQDNWWRYPKSDFPKNRYFKGDYSSPVCYCPNLTSNLSTRYNPQYNVAYPAPEFSGHIFGTTNRDVYRNYITQIVRATTANDNPVQTIPWIEPPLEGAAGELYPIHIADKSDILYIMQQHYLLGVKAWNVFNPSHRDATIGQARTDLFLETINDFKEWMQSQTKTARVRITS